MLLLVLIFVLAAFGLLLVALVTGTAAWAWISVAVSVAAAGALVYDWAQRRAAIRSGGGGDRTLSGAGSVAGGSHEPPTAAIPVMGGAMMDPRTEVFPPMRQGPPARPPVADAPETVAFRPVTPPPGSPERPSSAQPDGGTPGEQWSPRVTAGGRDRSGTPDAPAAARSGDHDGANAAQRTTRVGSAKGRDAEAGPGDAADPKAKRQPSVREQSEQWKPKQPARAERPSSDAAKPGDARDDDKAAAATTALSAAPAGAGKAPAGKAADRSGPDADSARTTAIPIADQKALAERRRAEQEKAQREKAQREKAEREKAEREKAEREKAERERAEREKAERAGARDAEPAAQDAEVAAEVEPAESAEAEQGAPPPRSGSPDPEEEQADSAEAAIVADLEDEVLVIDEHPRFHLAGCRVLSGNETIPLPAREAVEYGFTPCGTCTPVRTLAARNRAASSS